MRLFLLILSISLPLWLSAQSLTTFRLHGFTAVQALTQLPNPRWAVGLGGGLSLSRSLGAFTPSLEATASIRNGEAALLNLVDANGVPFGSNNTSFWQADTRLTLLGGYRFPFLSWLEAGTGLGGGYLLSSTTLMTTPLLPQANGWPDRASRRLRVFWPVQLGIHLGPTLLYLRYERSLTTALRPARLTTRSREQLLYGGVAFRLK